MQVIKQWAFSLCITGILSSLALLLSPSKKLEKSLKMACVFLFVICFCSPLAKLQIKPASLDITASSNAYITPAQSFCAGMEFLITALLRENGIVPSSVSVAMTPEGHAEARIETGDQVSYLAAKTLVESAYGVAVLPPDR